MREYMTETAAIFGKNMERLRKLKGISQEKLATGIGVSTFSVRIWENAEVSIKLENAVKVAKYLGVKVDDLLKEE